MWLRTFRYMSSADFLSADFKDDLEKIADRELTKELSKHLILVLSCFSFLLICNLSKCFGLRYHRRLNSWILTDSTILCFFLITLRAAYLDLEAPLFYLRLWSEETLSSHWSDFIASFLTSFSSGKGMCQSWISRDINLFFGPLIHIFFSQFIHALVLSSFKRKHIPLTSLLFFFFIPRAEGRYNSGFIVSLFASRYTYWHQKSQMIRCFHWFFFTDNYSVFLFSFLPL